MTGVDSWKVVLYLLPVALAMLWVRRREAAVGVTQPRELTPGQKAWILLVALPPGASALLMGFLAEDQIRGYLVDGSYIRGSGQNLVPGVVREFTSKLPGEWTRGTGRDLDELLGLLTRRAQSDTSKMARILVESWPPPELAEEAAPEAAAEPVQAAEEPAIPPAAEAVQEAEEPAIPPAAEPVQVETPPAADPVQVAEAAPPRAAAEAEESPAPQGEEPPANVHP